MASTTKTMPSSSVGIVPPPKVVVRPPRAPSPQRSPKAIKQPGMGVQLLTAGTAACVGDICTFPLDTAKVRLQVIQSLSRLCLFFIFFVL